VISNASAEYEAARRAVGFFERLDRGRIVVRGKDRASYLQGLLTNDVAALTAGQGCYTAYLPPQGRMISDLWVYELGDRMLMSLPLGTTPTVLARLDEFVFAEDVQLEDVTNAFDSVVVLGPSARVGLQAALSPAPLDPLDQLADHASMSTQLPTGPATIVRVVDDGEPGFEVVMARGHAAVVAEELRRHGGVPLSNATLEMLRIEAGIPVFHRDMDEETIPLEAGIESRAISFTKGCYVGQEVIVRVVHRGHGRVARKLVGLMVEGTMVPAPQSAVTSEEGVDIGRVTSSSWSLAVKRPVALAYLKRDFTEPGTNVRIGDREAVVSRLPFVTPGD